MEEYLHRMCYTKDKKIFCLSGPDNHIKAALLERGNWIENITSNIQFWHFKWALSDTDAD
jgi:hypothetical protein